MRNFIISLAVLLVAATLSIPGWAYQEVLDNAEVLNWGQLKLTGGLQGITDNGTANVTGIIDTGIQQDFGVRGLIGFGETDFYIGGLVKWIPIPDVDNQPAIGFNVGMTYATWMSDVTDTTLRFEPLISKKFAIETAHVTPYASFPLGIRMRSVDAANQSDELEDDTRLTSQLVVGTQLELAQWREMQFIGEIGLDIDETFSHIALGIVYYIDGFSSGTTSSPAAPAESGSAVDID